MNQSVFLKRSMLLLLSMSYIGLFSWCYISILSTRFSYYGLTYTTPAIEPLLIALAFAILPGFWLPMTLDKPSKAASWIIYIVAYVPICLVKLFWGEPNIYDYFCFVFVACVGFFIVNFSNLMKEKQITGLPISEKKFSTIILSIFIISNLLILSVFKSSAKLINLDEVYDQRANYKSTIGYLGNFFPYLIALTTNTINIYMLTESLRKGKYLWLLLASLSQFLIFSITGLKVTLFSFPFIFMVYFLFSRKDRFAGWFPISFIGLLFMIMFAVSIDKFTFTANLVLRRFLTMQGQLTPYFVDFFSNHPKCLLGYSFLKKFSWYPYSGPPSSFVGNLYLNRSGMWSNVNFFADAYANFGYGGILAYCLLLSVILYIYNSMSKKMNAATAAAFASIFALNLVNTSLLVSLFTHGFILTLTFIYFHPEHKSSPGDRKD